MIRLLSLRVLAVLASVWMPVRNDWHGSLAVDVLTTGQDSQHSRFGGQQKDASTGNDLAGYCQPGSPDLLTTTTKGIC